jgi:hypothetical protein
VAKVFNISKNAVGTVLAAFGTALSESIVTLIAVVFGTNSSQKDISSYCKKSLNLYESTQLCFALANPP